MVRDERRFKMADRDGDMAATKEEFTAFLHPEEYDYMKDIVVQVGPGPTAPHCQRFPMGNTSHWVPIPTSHWANFPLGPTSHWANFLLGPTSH